MAETKTQDNQKVFHSALANFQQFMGGGMEKPSSSASKNMDAIYGNVAKMFEAFTKGILTTQGSNSEILLRTIYRSLNKDFINIIQNSDAVDKIVDIIKTKQGSITLENAGDVLASETMKQVALNQLKSDEVDISSVVLDFVDELQTSIL